MYLPQSDLLERVLTLNFVKYAIPLFFVAILAEVVLTQRRKRHQYRVSDTLTCLATGVTEELTGVFSSVLTSFVYLALYRHCRLLEMQSFTAGLKVLCWLVLIVALDLSYYGFHRAAHRMNLGWGGHIVHHSSEEYNLAVALRQSSFQQYFSWIFYLPLALVGFPPAWFVSVFSLNLVYQFWIHTREVDRFPSWIEAVMNTPSHHRVHHGTNPQYIDKNYAGIFIVWDRWFGTFEPEGETPRYGITTPVRSWNPLWINFHYYIYLLKASFAAPSLVDALRLWMAGPEWAPQWLVEFRGEQPKATEKFDIQITRRRAAYCVFNFVCLLGLAVVWLEAKDLSQTRSILFVVSMIFCLYSVGALLELKRGEKLREALRLPLTFIIMPLLLNP